MEQVPGLYAAIRDKLTASVGSFLSQGILMTNIKRVGHVVLHVENFESCVAFYRDVLGMEVVDYRPQRGRAFLSFGEQHHDIGIFKDEGARTRGTLGMAHIAFQVEGEIADLKIIYDRAIKHRAKIDHIRDHGFTKSLYIRDPEENLVEVYIDGFPSLKEGLDYMREHGGGGKPLDIGQGAPA